MSPIGTFETCLRTPNTSAYGGRPEVIGARPKRREWLLQKSFWGVERKFLEPLVRFARGDVRDHIG